MEPLFISQPSAVLGMEGAIEALDQAFAGELPHAPQRQHLEIGPADLLVMPSWGEDRVGVKLVTVAPGNPERGLPLVQGVYVLFDRDTSRPLAVMPGADITAIRTAAVSGVATKRLAPPGARHLVIFGAGTQAHAHLEAMTCVTAVEKVTVVSRTASRAGALADEARRRGLDALVGDPSDVAAADIVCTCTTSEEPVFDGTLIKAGCHINAVGAYRQTARELDDAVMTAAKVVVETREVALREAGEVRIPVEAGLLHIDDVTELSEVARDKAVRTSAEDVTVFKSVGVAFEDLVVARAAYEAAGR